MLHIVYFNLIGSHSNLQVVYTRIFLRQRLSQNTSNKTSDVGYCGELFRGQEGALVGERA